jgi:RNase P subunit RPR2
LDGCGRNKTAVKNLLNLIGIAADNTRYPNSHICYIERVEAIACENHYRLHGMWLRFYKKDSNIPLVDYNEALDEAFCYGWIDGQLKPYD